jgi:hypothetical protein
LDESIGYEKLRVERTQAEVKNRWQQRECNKINDRLLDAFEQGALPIKEAMPKIVLNTVWSRAA